MKKGFLLVLCLLAATAGAQLPKLREMKADAATAALQWPDLDTFRQVNGFADAANLSTGTLNDLRLSIHVVRTNAVGGYADPAWITSLAWSKITGTPTTRAGYGITDAQPLSANLSVISANANPSTLNIPNVGINAASLSGNGVSITNLNASNLASGSVDVARLPNINASNLTSGVIPILRGGDADIAKGRTMNAFAKLTAGTAPLRVLGMGASTSEGSLNPAMIQLAQAIGFAGQCTNQNQWVIIDASTAAAVAAPEFMPTRSLFYELESAEWVTYGANSSHTHAVGDTVTVIYRRSSGAGDFKIQARTDFGSWVDQGATVSTANSTADIASASRTLSGFGPWQVRILSTSGTVQIYNPVLFGRASGPGLFQTNIANNAWGPGEYASGSTAARRGWLDAMQPDVIFIIYYGGAAASDITTLQGDLAALGRDTTTDIVMVGEAQSSTGYANTASIDEVRQMREVAAQTHIAFIDQFEWYNPRFLSDTVHPDVAGYLGEAHNLMHKLGWLEIPAVKLADKHLSVTTSYEIIPDVAYPNFSPSSQVKVYVTPGLWRLKSAIMVTCDTDPGSWSAALLYNGQVGSVLSDAVHGIGSNDSSYLTFFKPAYGDGAPSLEAGYKTGLGNVRFEAEHFVRFVDNGMLTISVAKGIAGNTATISTGSYIEATRVSD